MKIQRPPLKLFLPIFLISMFAIVSFAVTVTTTTTTNQAQSGVLFNVAGGFTAASNGYVVVQATAAASANPCPWASAGTCQTALTAGDWQYSVTLTINSGVAVSTTFTMTVQQNTGTGYTSLPTLRVTTPASITAGQTMTFLFDLSSTSFTAPVGIVITVA